MRVTYTFLTILLLLLGLLIYNAPWLQLWLAWAG
jgi:hypothetical protein